MKCYLLLPKLLAFNNKPDRTNVQSKSLNAIEGISVIQILTNAYLHSVYNMQLVSDDGASFNQKFIK